MLFSCLVDADYLDTETAIQGGQPRGKGETLERLLEKLNAHVAPWLEAPANDLCAKRSAIFGALSARRRGRAGAVHADRADRRRQDDFLGWRSPCRMR